jgi:hypothetical protein
MLKKLTRKFVTLFVLVMALTVVSAAPDSSANRWWPRCQWVPVDVNCSTGWMCCDEYSCWCE